ncbi:hypothetical protein H6A33_08610 [Collinsella tanakaei]|nr:hypothetical protein [Collinsella tanakaei]
MQRDDLRVIEIPEDAVIVTREGELGVEAAAGPMETIMRFKFFVIALLIVAGIVSAVPMREIFSSPDTFASTIATLDEKKANVLGMVTASTAASVAITVGPDDVGTPIAEKLMDLSSNLMLILGVLYLEKYLLTIFGFATFGVLIPLALLFLIGAILLYRRSGASAVLARLAAKLVVLGAVLVATVPAGVAVTDMIDRTYEISYTIEDEPQEETDAEEGADNPIDFILSLPETVVDAASSIGEDLLAQVNRLIEGVAVMLVTSCVIPVLVLLFFLWIANMLLGINVDAPMHAIANRGRRMMVNRNDIAAVKAGIKKHRAGTDSSAPKE